MICKQITVEVETLIMSLTQINDVEDTDYS